MAERRRHSRYTRFKARGLRLLIDGPSGEPKALAAHLIDAGEGGLGVEVPEPVLAGTAISAAGEIHDERGRLVLERRARVVSCFPAHGVFRVGISFLDLGYWNPFFRDESERARPFAGASGPRGSFIDYYELLQVSPRAEAETIHRLYRHLATKYHPDNQTTGNEESFKLLHKAYQVLSDPEQRALYDHEHTFHAGLQRRTFDQKSAALSMKTEPAKRQAVLAALYKRSLYASDQPGLSLREIEEFLGCSREVFEFALWFLREKKFIQRTDNGRYTITAAGVDAAETHRGPVLSERRLLPTEAASAAR